MEVREVTEVTEVRERGRKVVRRLHRFYNSNIENVFSNDWSGSMHNVYCSIHVQNIFG